MSEKHDHNHPHDDHHHDHDHGHEVPAGGSPTPKPESMEDSGSQALSEALRSSFAIVKVIMVLLVLVFFGSGFFTVPSQEKAVILRFGKPIGAGQEQLLQPGAHWAFPYPVDEVVRIPFSQYQTVSSTVGWYATTPEAEASNSEPPAGPSLNPAGDGYTLTGDGNIIHIRATMRYRINDPLSYALKFVNASNLVQNALNEALFYSSAYFTVDQALRLNTLGLKDKISQRIQQSADRQQLGIIVEQVELTTRAPRYVEPAFASVLAAEQERGQTNQLAQSYANRMRSSARAEAESMINTAKADKTRLVQALAAEAMYFTNQLPYYKRNPRLFVERVQTEVVGRILTNSVVEKNFVPDRSDGRQRELWLQLSREPQKPNARAQ